MIDLESTKKRPAEGEAGREGTERADVSVVFLLRGRAQAQAVRHAGLVVGGVRAGGDAGGEGAGGAAGAVGDLVCQRRLVSSSSSS